MAEKKSTKKPVVKLTEQEILEWDELYKHVKYNVMNYDKTFNLPPHMVLKLKELSTGRLFANKNHESKYSYTFKEIFLTFKFCTSKIEYVIKTKQFESEIRKFNYIMAIIKNNINDVVLQLKKHKKEQSKIENENMDHLLEVAEYKPIQKKINKRLQDLI